MLAEIKNNSLIKLTKHEIDKLSNAMIIGFIVAFISQILYKSIGLSRSVDYQIRYIFGIEFNRERASKILFEFFDRMYLSNVGISIIALLVLFVAAYSIYIEFNKKNQTAYTILLLPVSRTKILLGKIITIIGFFIITYAIITLVDIGFSLILASRMLENDARHIIENLVYMIPNMQFTMFAYSAIDGLSMLGLGLFIDIATKGFVKPLKIVVIVIVSIITILIQLPVMFILGYFFYVPFKIIFPILILILSFILFSKKCSV
ncbi:MAG: ABC transporter permease [Sarcina sp.]